MSKQIYSPEDTAELRATIGGRCRARRIAMGMTQKQAAQAIGITTEFYARNERGNCLPSIETITGMATAFDVSVDHLLGIDKPSVPMAPASYESSRDIEFVTNRAREDPELTRVLIAILKMCANQERRAS